MIEGFVYCGAIFS